MTRPRHESDDDWDAAVAEWLAGLFSTALTPDAIDSYRSGLGAMLLDDLEQRAGCRLGVASMRAVLTGLQDSRQLTRQLGTAFATLFEGSGGSRTVSPFESAHVSAGGRLLQAPAIDMERRLREAGLATTIGARDPADHLSTELALLAHLLRDSQCRSAAGSFLEQRLLSWVGGFGEQLRQADRTGFYAGAGLVLSNFVETLSATVPAIPALAVPSIGQTEWRTA